jgi:hypothetical protein
MSALKVEYFIDILSLIILRPITGMSCYTKASNLSGRLATILLRLPSWQEMSEEENKQLHENKITVNY